MGLYDWYAQSYEDGAFMCLVHGTLLHTSAQLLDPLIAEVHTQYHSIETETVVHSYLGGCGVLSLGPSLLCSLHYIGHIVLRALSTCPGM